MPADPVHQKLRCPKCGHEKLGALPKKRGDWGAWGVPGFRCPKCSERYPVVEGGILRMIPKGDYSRYEYWEKLYQTHDISQIVAFVKRRWADPDAFKLTFYIMPRLAKALGWSFEDSVELGCGWGTYSLSLFHFGLTKRIVLLDISISALKGTLQAYKALGITPYLMQGEIHHLPFRDRAFDVSLSGGLYEHFVGEEQRQLVAENCRISRRVLCQLPKDSLTYWVYRKLVTLWMGKWPFGFEVPLKRRALRELFQDAGCRVAGEEFHNLATAAVLVMSNKLRLLTRFTWRPGFFILFSHDQLIAVETGEKKGTRAKKK